MILTVGGEKGGPGKSTVATTLAAMRAAAGRQVLLINADAQSTSIYWAAARRDHPEVPQVTAVTMRGQKIHTEIADMASRFDDVVIDTGGHDCVELRSAMVASDRLLMPLRPSQPDIWTLEKMAQIIDQVGVVNDRLRCFVFVNQVPSTSRDRLRVAMSEVMAVWPQFQLLKTAWMFRAAFGGAIGEGLSVHEMKPRDGKAAAEASFLYGEIDFRMKLKATPPKPVESAAPADDKVAAFIGGVTAASPAPSPAPQPVPRNPISAPWKAERVRGDMLVQVNVRLPEPLALKLKHVSHMTDRQRQDLVAEALEPLLNAKLLELGYTDDDL